MKHVLFFFVFFFNVFRVQKTCLLSAVPPVLPEQNLGGRSVVTDIHVLGTRKLINS